MNMFKLLVLFLTQVTRIAEATVFRGLLTFKYPETSLYVHGIGVGEDGKRIMVNDEITYVYHDDSGVFKFQETNKFLNVDVHGKLVAASYPDIRFHLQDKPGSLWAKVLKYNEQTTFQLCADQSIGISSSCAGAREIQVEFDLGWPFLSEEFS